MRFVVVLLELARIAEVCYIYLLQLQTAEEDTGWADVTMEVAQAVQIFEAGHDLVPDVVDASLVHCHGLL
jgi:hypothetical protein